MKFNTGQKGLYKHINMTQHTLHLPQIISANIHTTEHQIQMPKKKRKRRCKCKCENPHQWSQSNLKLQAEGSSLYLVSSLYWPSCKDLSIYRSLAVAK